MQWGKVEEEKVIVTVEGRTPTDWTLSDRTAKKQNQLAKNNPSPVKMC